MTGLEFNQWQISVHFGGVSIDLFHQVSAGTSLVELGKQNMQGLIT